MVDERDDFESVLVCYKSQNFWSKVASNHRSKIELKVVRKKKRHATCNAINQICDIESKICIFCVFVRYLIMGLCFGDQKCDWELECDEMKIKVWSNNISPKLLTSSNLWSNCLNPLRNLWLFCFFFMQCEIHFNWNLKWKNF